MKFLLVAILLVVACKPVHRQSSDPKGMPEAKLAKKIFGNLSSFISKHKNFSILKKMSNKEVKALKELSYEELNAIRKLFGGRFVMPSEELFKIVDLPDAWWVTAVRKLTNKQWDDVRKLSYEEFIKLPDVNPDLMTKEQARNLQHEWLDYRWDRIRRLDQNELLTIYKLSDKKILSLNPPPHTRVDNHAKQWEFISNLSDKEFGEFFKALHSN